jgi:tetratricopeptide (TPR) repeat protein
MRLFNPKSILLISLQFLFIFQYSLSSKDKRTVDGIEFDELLIKEDRVNELPNPTYSIHPMDFIIAKGQGFTGEPPNSKISFQVQSETIDNIGKYNNSIINGLVSKELSISEAINKLKLAIKNNPIYVPTRYNLARLLSIKGELDSSILEFEKVLEFFPDYYRSHYHLGILYRQKQNDRLAEFHFRKSSSLTELHEEPRFELCEISHDYPGNPSSYRKYPIKNYPDSPEFHHELCNSKIKKVNKYKSFNRLIQLKPDNQSYGYSKKYHLYLGNLAFELEKYAIAIKEWETLLQFPYDPVFITVPKETISYKIKLAESINNKIKKD